MARLDIRGVTKRYGQVDVLKRVDIDLDDGEFLVLLVPERSLLVGRLDDVICATAQLVRPSRNNEAQGHSAQLTTNFVAPWARGHGLARGIVLAVEEEARAQGVSVLNLDVRETQAAAIQLYQSLGYQHYGTHARYARVDGQWVAGLFFWKELA